jgi:hypothetical protein
MKGPLKLAIIGLLVLGLTAAPLWAVDPPRMPGAFVDADEPFMTDRVLEEDLNRTPGLDHDFDQDMDRDFDDDDVGEVREQLRKDIPELSEEADSQKES